MNEITLLEFLNEKGYLSIQMEKNVVGHFEVQSLINKLPARLLVDTGASCTVIARASAARLGLDLIESEVKAGGVGAAQHAVADGIIETLQIQSFRTRTFPVSVIDLSHVNQALVAHGGAIIDGAIGGDLMSSQGAVIDYAKATIYLKRS
jgi:clan AA aspartic protease (TIGR02281 family)